MLFFNKSKHILKFSQLHNIESSKKNVYALSSWRAAVHDDLAVDIIFAIRSFYGVSLSRDHLNKVDASQLNDSNREALRKLKISLANQGKKPWNSGIKHKPDIVEKIRKKTREAMHRREVRERWRAHWVPKAHTEETKTKLRTIMLNKEKGKIKDMSVWLLNDVDIASNYHELKIRRWETYRRAFNVKRRISYSQSNLNQILFIQALRCVLHESFDSDEANSCALELHTHNTGFHESARHARDFEDDLFANGIGATSVKGLNKARIIVRKTKSSAPTQRRSSVRVRDVKDVQEPNSYIYSMARAGKTVSSRRKSRSYGGASPMVLLKNQSLEYDVLSPHRTELKSRTLQVFYAVDEEFHKVESCCDILQGDLNEASRRHATLATHNATHLWHRARRRFQTLQPHYHKHLVTYAIAKQNG